MERLSLAALLVSSAAVNLVNAAPTDANRNPISKRASIPDYALTYAPYTYLYSGEEWWPSDIATHIQHVTPEIDYVNVTTGVTLQNLSSYGSDVYLTSKDNVEDNPAWLLGVEPDSSGYTSAPATIIIAEKNDSIVDAFYFYFYSYNHGPKVLGSRYGNHVGDWEHSMIRFNNSEPAYVYYSEHSGGSAYTYDAVAKSGVRPIVYVATGSHANYATAGTQDYTDFGNIVTDTTDAGPYWDVTQNYRGFYYDVDAGSFTEAGGADVGATEEAGEGVGWLSFEGLWGDKQYPTSDSRQSCTAGECHYVDGPTGPEDKNLGRTAVCEDEDDCTIKTSV